MSAEFTARTFEETDYSSPLKFVLSHIFRHKLILFLLILGALSNAALASAVPGFIGEAFNQIADGAELAVVRTFALYIIASQLGRGVLQLMRNYSAEIFAQRVERDVRDELYASLLAKSMAYHDSTPTGEIMARVVNDVREMNLMMSPGLNLVVGSSFFLIVPTLASPLIHPALIITPLAFLILYAIVQYRYTRSIHVVGKKVRRSFAALNTRLAESLDGVEIVKGTAQEQQESEIFEELADDVRDRFIEQGHTEARYVALLLLGAAVVGGVLHSIILWNAGAIETGDIVNYIGQLSLFGFPVFSSTFSLSRIALGYASAERILSLLNAHTSLDQNEAGRADVIQGAILFDGVHFGYGTEPTEHSAHVAEDISFEVKPGQTVALVGQTGAGKSTVAKLINRTYDVEEGQVLIDGVNVRDWNLEALRSQISIIEQEIFLFTRTVAENVAYGKPGATHEDVVDAAKKAQAHDFIMQMPNGYDTVVGQRGVTLSGGQRQRIAIARAFLTNPRILILDDSTSAIDSATEDEIQKAIWAAAEGRTTLIITHRLSQIRWADHIVVLKQGRVVAQGAHEDLLRQSEAYQRIFARND